MPRLRRAASTFVIALAACLCAPAVGDAGPADSCSSCASKVFVKYLPWKAFDARGARWNPIAAPAIKARLKAYARGNLDAFRSECGRDQFTRKVCRAAAKCAIAGGAVLWAGVQTGQPAWQAEIAAFNACWAAILTEFVP
jgi:hypothetical protein